MGYLDWEELGFCCGVLVLGRFDELSDIESKTIRDDYLVRDLNELKTSNKPIIATLSQRQWGFYEHVLIENMFTQIFESYNPNHGTLVRLYIWLPERKENKYAV